MLYIIFIFVSILLFYHYSFQKEGFITIPKYNKILYVLKNNGIKHNNLNYLLGKFKKYKLQVIDIFLITLKNDKKIITKWDKLLLNGFMTKEYYNYQIRNNIQKNVLVIITDISNSTKDHIKIKWRFRDKFGMSTLHCSDNNNDSEIELNNILGKNKILYYESNTKRNKMKIYKENKYKL